MWLYSLIGLLAGGFGVFLILHLTRSSGTEKVSSKVEEELNRIFPEALNRASEQLVRLAEEKLGSEKKEIKTDLENKKTAIDEAVKRVLQELKVSHEKLELAERERIGSFKALKQEVESQAKVTQELSVSTDNLKKILSNNQTRGQFGEQVADDLLKMSGFVQGVDYVFNKQQSTTGTRPDFTVFLPSGLKINVDSKFPYANLQRIAETEDKDAKVRYRKAFEQDVKQKIKQVTSRDYIDPDEDTVDFVVLFIPNEMIFSFIYEKMNEVWLEAMRSKVVLAGPFSFTAILRLVRQAHDNFSYQKNIREIVKGIKVFEKEFEKYNEEFKKIGERIKSLDKQYQSVEVTRTNQLVRSIDRITLNKEDQDLLQNPLSPE